MGKPKTALVFPTHEGSPFDAVLDARIVDAMLRARGDMRETLEILGYKKETLDAMSDVQIRREAEELAGRPGVRKFAEVTLSEIEDSKDAILRRQMMVALYGDKALSLQASYFLAQVMGWIAPKKVQSENTNKNVTFTAVLNDDKLIKAALRLKHEPGEAVAITSEARDDEEGEDESAA